MVIIIQDIEETKKAHHLEKGMVTRHKKHGLVFITGGHYMGTYGVSNFFDRKKINQDGTLDDKKEYHDYDNRGDFLATERQTE